MLYLIRYGEIGLKSSQVRRRLRDRLITNIQDAFLNERVECITSWEEGRVFVRSENEKVADHVLSRTFGIVSFSPVIESSSSVADIIAKVLRLFREDLEGSKSFAIRARRTGTHPYTSQDLARKVGSAVLSEFPELKVDLQAPELEINIEVRGRKSYLFKEAKEGPGGLPLGSQGKVVGLVENIRDAVSCWLMMKRGCKVHFAFFAENQLVSVLEGWDPQPRSHQISSEDDLIALAGRIRAYALVFGDSLENVSFRKNKYLAVFYPVIGLSSDEISLLADRIGLDHHSHEEAQ